MQATMRLRLGDAKPKKIKDKIHFKTHTRTFPHVILFDFESIMDRNQRKESRAMLIFGHAHVSISVSIGDTLEQSPRTSAKGTLWN